MVRFDSNFFKFHNGILINFSAFFMFLQVIFVFSSNIYFSLNDQFPPTIFSFFLRAFEPKIHLEIDFSGPTNLNEKSISRKIKNSTYFIVSNLLYLNIRVCP